MLFPMDERKSQEALRGHALLHLLELLEMACPKKSNDFQWIKISLYTILTFKDLGKGAF